MPSKFLNPTPEQFNVLNARTYLENITALGPRITGMKNERIIKQPLLGTENLEIKATRILIDFLLEIQAKAPPHVLIEIEVQHPSSYFYLDFLGGMINVIYTSIPPDCHRSTIISRMLLLDLVGIAVQKRVTLSSLIRTMTQ